MSQIPYNILQVINFLLKVIGVSVFSALIRSLQKESKTLSSILSLYT